MKGTIQRVRKTKCPGCGAEDLVYQTSSIYCYYCWHPIEYEEICMCVSDKIENCERCKKENEEI